jgi:nicotinate-nucleotide--dimethylbenzimidazole phosphoribosyltransferase
MAKYFGCEVVVADMGIACPYSCPEILDCRIANGTKNFVSEPAMTREETLRAVLTGIRLAGSAKGDNVDLIGVGEMGIGNTTTSSAVLSALTGASVEEVTGGAEDSPTKPSRRRSTSSPGR